MKKISELRKFLKETKKDERGSELMNERQQTLSDLLEFSIAMKKKLELRFKEGRGGYKDMSSTSLSLLLRALVEKGDPVDVANVCMMLHANGGKIEQLQFKTPLFTTGVRTLKLPPVEGDNNDQ